MPPFTAIPLILQPPLVQQLEQRRLISGNSKPIKIKKASKMLFPHGIERTYTNYILGLTNDMYRKFRTSLERLRPLYDLNPNIRMDGPDEDIVRFMTEIRISLGDVSDNEIKSAVALTGVDISNFQRAQLLKVISSMIGVDPFISEPWLRDQLLLWNTQNVALIKSIPDRFYNEVEEIMFRSYINGRRFEEMIPELRKRYDISKNRARLIARDQTEKLNGKLNQLRQESLGLKDYTWRTVGDSRVRPRHAVREGKVFLWKKPPFGGHPGQDYNCRCYAEPRLEGIING